MKKLLSFLLLLVSTFCFSSCSVESVNGEQVAVFVMKPYFFGKGGIDPQPLLQGSETIAATTDVVYFTSTPIAYKEHFEDLITVDKYPVDFDATLTLEIIAAQAPSLLSGFGQNWYINSVQPEFRRMVRQRASRYQMAPLISNIATDTIESRLEADVRQFLLVNKIPARCKDVSLGKASPPDEVLAETNRTAAQAQNKMTQIQRVAAESSRKDAENQKAIADKAYMVGMGMSMQQYLQLRQLENDHEMLEIARTNKNVKLIYMPRGITPTMPVQ